MSPPRGERVVNTLCNMCGYHCGMKVFTRDGKIRRIVGNREHPVSRGKLCAKGLSAIQLEYEPNRLLYPLKRVGERGEKRWERITWDEALGIIKDEIERIVHEYGAEGVAWHRGTAPRWWSSWVFLQRFMNAIGSPNLATHNHNCHVPRFIAHHYTYGGMPIPDYDRARCVVLWGYNPAETSVVRVMRSILDARERGARLIVVDPHFSRTAMKADIFVQPRPGTDGALALGMLNTIIDEGLYDDEFVSNWTLGFRELCEMVERYEAQRVEAITGVPRDLIRTVSRMYATEKPAVLQDGNGLDQHTNVVQTTRAIAALRAVTGNLGVKGGHIFQPPLGLKDLSLGGRIEGGYERSVSTHPLYYDIPSSGIISTPEIIDAILTGRPYPIRALIVQASAVGIISSNRKRVMEALRKLDFLVVHDIFMTSTAELADLVLPAATFLERSLLCITVGPTVESRHIGMMDEAVEPRGECWSDLRFILELAKRLGFAPDFKWDDYLEFFDEELEPLGLTVEKIRSQPGGVLIEYRPEEVYESYRVGGFKTVTGKVELYSKTFEELGYDPLPEYVEPSESPLSDPNLFEEYPLICGTGLKPGIYTHSQFRTLPWLKTFMPEALAFIYPKDAEKYGVADGEMVTIESPNGRIDIRAEVSESVKEGVVMMPHGWGHPYAGGAAVNDLTGDLHREPISGATGNRSFLCRIRKGEG